MHSNNFELNDDADSILYTDDRLTLIEMQIDEEIEPFMDDTFLDYFKISTFQNPLMTHKL